jgi:glycosyltransferase involved in cell wall biosynthesis
VRTRRIAIIADGGLVGGHFNQGVPALVELFGRLSEAFELTAYQARRVLGAELSARPYRVRNFQPRAGGLALAPQLIVEHMRAPYALVHGLWGGTARLAVRAARLLRVPAVVSLLGGEVANVASIGYGGLRMAGGRRNLTWIGKYADSVTTGSLFQAARLREACGVESTTIPLGVDTDRFAFHPRMPRPPYEFLHVANLTEVKDQNTMLRAFARIRTAVPARLTVVGPDYLGGALQAGATALGLRGDVRFEGAVCHTEIPGRYQAAHILLHTSLFESQAVAAVEAMSSGAVVCGTAVGILADLADRCCLVVPPGDANALADAVLDLLRTPARFWELQSAAREWAVMHCAAWTAQRFEHLYESLIESRA